MACMKRQLWGKAQQLLTVLQRVGSQKCIGCPYDFNCCDNGELLVMIYGCDGGASCGVHRGERPEDHRPGP